MYYKIIKNGLIIDTGTRFLYWQSRNKILLGCSIEIANYLLSDLEKIYETYWLQIPPSGAPEYENVIAEEITEEEYKTLQAILSKEEAIPVPE